MVETKVYAVNLGVGLYGSDLDTATERARRELGAAAIDAHVDARAFVLCADVFRTASERLRMLASMAGDGYLTIVTASGRDLFVRLPVDLGVELAKAGVLSDEPDAHEYDVNLGEGLRFIASELDPTEDLDPDEVVTESFEAPELDF